MMANGLSLIFQEYIPGPPRQHVFVDGFVDRGGRMIATFARRRLRMFPPDFGNSSYMVSIAPDEAAPAIAALERLLGNLSYRGVFSAEFKQDPRDGGFKILEVNCRPWWYVEFASRCGVNVCDLAYRDALEQPLTPPRRYRVGRACVYPYYDFFAAREEWRRGALSLLAWASSWLRAMQPVFRWADPFPGLRAGTAVIAGFVRRRLRRR
jgi:D-aspartate ligase